MRAAPHDVTHLLESSVMTHQRWRVISNGGTRRPRQLDTSGNELVPDQSSPMVADGHRPTHPACLFYCCFLSHQLSSRQSRRSSLLSRLRIPSSLVSSLDFGSSFNGVKNRSLVDGCLPHFPFEILEMLQREDNAMHADAHNCSSRTRMETG